MKSRNKIHIEVFEFIRHAIEDGKKNQKIFFFIICVIYKFKNYCGILMSEDVSICKI